MSIRYATLADVEVLAGIEHDLFGVDAWSADLLRGGVGETMVAVVDSVVVGFVVLSVAGVVADLQRIGVVSTARRSGVAHRLLHAALEALSGADRVLLEVRADNADARAFYDAEGFTEIARRSGYYRGGTDALVLGRTLQSTVQR